MCIVEIVSVTDSQQALLKSSNFNYENILASI